MFGCIYVILDFDPHVFVFARRSTSSHTPLNRIFWFIDLYPWVKVSPQTEWVKRRLKLKGKASPQTEWVKRRLKLNG